MFSDAWQAIAEFVGAYRRPMLVIATIVVVLLIYRLVTGALRSYMLSRAHKPDNVRNFLFFWRYIWLGVAAVFFIVSFSGSLAALGISAAFLGMILGWSLQAPVTGIAAWLMIILKRPFRIGDRVIIAGIIGDVVDINLTHVVLNQVGGTVGGEEKSGRGVLIPNAILFQQIIYNYAFETKYILDEVVVNVTFESDFDRAEEICLAAARQVTREIIEETDQWPFIRAEITDWGVRIRLRYQSMAVERQRISSDIAEVILREFRECEEVEFCYPHTEILHRPKNGLEAATGPSGAA